MPVAIKVENLSKVYQIGQIGTGTLQSDLKRWYARTTGKEDPFLKVGETNDRTVKGKSDVVWSLKDINVEIKQGEAVGIIGRNGAGKSTLLKILSRVTAPTTGKISGAGRVASLLEVGTGFHPDLTGRENIYLNGAILGMRKKEIARKFDNIVDFSGVERYIDTPVKRYSSGMYVRLAFAVAAHLESEILIIDEVLAVGDAEFQKKCLGKMGEVSKGEGRTVLFVSHNMNAIKSLCTTGIFLKNGMLQSLGLINNVLEDYQLENEVRSVPKLDAEGLKNGQSHFYQWETDNERSKFSVQSGDDFKIVFSFFSSKNYEAVELGLVLRDSKENIIYSVNSRDFNGDFFKLIQGTYEFVFKMNLPIKSADYFIDIVLVSNNVLIDQWLSPTPLKVLNHYKSVLGDKWSGILSKEASFEFYLKQYAENL